MFKDSWARDKYWELVGRVQELRGMIRGGLVDMNGPTYIATNPILERLDKIEARLNSTELVEKPCPTCGRVTLMKKHISNTLEGTYTLNDWTSSTVTVTSRTDAFYCYGCGGTFRESTKAVLEEVKA
jgi:hypothetical protein